jgi:hypothetical protein
MPGTQYFRTVATGQINGFGTSQQIKRGGLIACDLDGTCSNYRLNDTGFELLKTFLAEFLGMVEQHRAEPKK